MKKKLFKKFNSGSVLVFSLFILFIMLTAALGVASVTVKDKITTSSSDKSNQSFQTADSGVEILIKSIIDNPTASIGNLDAAGTCADGIISGEIIEGKTYQLKVYDQKDNQLLCDDEAFEVTRVKSIGTYGSNIRAIDAPVSLCAKFINICEELQNIQDDLEGRYCLGQDIDCAGVNFTPLGEFSGILDGRGYEIKDLTIDSSDANDWGFFKEIGPSALIRRTGFKEFNFTFSNHASQNIGGIVGIIREDAENRGFIVNSYIDEGTITVTNDIQAFAVGGLVGENGGEIRNSYFSGKIDVLVGTDVKIGGLAGWNKNSIRESYSIGENIGIETLSTTGGIAGNNQRGAEGINNSYSAMELESGGGLVGFQDINTQIINSYWDKDISVDVMCGPGGEECNDGNGKTTEQMKTQSTYSGWDFTDLTGIWKIEEGISYPCHQWNRNECPE